MISLSSYPKVYNVGHREIVSLFDAPVLVQEKVDGSQFSFGVVEGELCCRSKSKQIDIEYPDKLFNNAVGVICALFEEGLIPPGFIFRCEYLAKPKHNTLVYDRVPKNHLVIFDVMKTNQFTNASEEYAQPNEVAILAERVDLEVVPTHTVALIVSVDELKGLLDCDSFLGGTKVEGVVLKRYDAFTRDGKAMMGKYVSEVFKEKHGADWKKRNPGGKDFIEKLVAQLRTTARWEKAVQRLRDDGTLLDEPKDIGALMKSVSVDTLEEESEWIKEQLFKYAWPKISRGVTAGLAQWYKDLLAAASFENGDDKQLSGSTEPPTADELDCPVCDDFYGQSK